MIPDLGGDGRRTSVFSEAASELDSSSVHLFSSKLDVRDDDGPPSAPAVDHEKGEGTGKDGDDGNAHEYERSGGGDERSRRGEPGPNAAGAADDAVAEADGAQTEAEVEAEVRASSEMEMEGADETEEGEPDEAKERTMDAPGGDCADAGGMATEDVTEESSAADERVAVPQASPGTEESGLVGEGEQEAPKRLVSPESTAISTVNMTPKKQSERQGETVRGEGGPMNSRSGDPHAIPPKNPKGCCLVM